MLQTAPKNYRKLVRLGAYGSWLNQYLCGMTFRVTDLEGGNGAIPVDRPTHGEVPEP